MIDTLEVVPQKKLTKKQRFMEFLMEAEGMMSVNPLKELPLQHEFTDKMYIRSVFIPAGVFLTSRVHLTEHPYQVSMGKIVIGTLDGLITMEAGYRGVTKKNTIRCGYAVTDTIWSTYHYNEDNCRNLEVIEKRLFKDYIVDRK